MGWIAPVLTAAEVAECIADTDRYWTTDGTEFEIDTADYGKRDGTVRLEGYVLDADDQKHYLEVRVRVELVEIDDMPYDVEYDDGYNGDEEDEDDD